jgi:hypothetical protein
VIAKWIFELLRRERDWRAALPKIADRLTELSEDRVRAALDLGAAFEHIEPDRYHAIRAYQLAGPGRDRGRSRALAIEIGWWQAVGRLAQLEISDKVAHEPLIAACRSLIDDGKLDAAIALFAERVPAGPARDHAELAGLRAELEGRNGEWKALAAKAKTMHGPAAADAFVSAARLARADKQRNWKQHLEAALSAHPEHAVATSMLTDEATAREDDGLVFELMRLRLLGLDGIEYVDGLRAIATRLLLADPAYHTGMGRRLVKVAIERAYSSEVNDIPGHLSLWSLLDKASAEDGQRSELLPLILRALDHPIPDFDRTYLAALGAEICIEAGNREAARSYAAIVAEHAPSHPIVRELLEDCEEVDGVDISDELEVLAVDGEPPPVESLLPDDDDFGLDFDRITQGAKPDYQDGWSRPDPRFVDVRVHALDDRAAPSGEPAPAVAAPAVTAEPDEPAIVNSPALQPIEPTPPKPETAAGMTTTAPTMTTATPQPAKPTLDDEWNVDEELFRRRRPTTVRPPDNAPEMQAVPPRSEPAPAPAAPATAAPAAAIAPPGPPFSIIPSAAVRVLKQSGAPRPLPKLPSPPNLKPRADRLLLPVDVRVDKSGEIIHVHTRDLSATGFFAVTNAPLEVGTEVTCDVRMPKAGELSGTTFSTRAKIARRDNGGYGFALVEPPQALIDAIAAHK